MLPIKAPGASLGLCRAVAPARIGAVCGPDGALPGTEYSSLRRQAPPWVYALRSGQDKGGWHRPQGPCSSLTSSITDGGGVVRMCPSLLVEGRSRCSWSHATAGRLRQIAPTPAVALLNVGNTRATPEPEHAQPCFPRRCALSVDPVLRPVRRLGARWISRAGRAYRRGVSWTRRSGNLSR